MDSETASQGQPKYYDLQQLLQARIDDLLPAVLGQELPLDDPTIFSPTYKIPLWTSKELVQYNILCPIVAAEEVWQHLAPQDRRYLKGLIAELIHRKVTTKRLPPVEDNGH